VILKLTNFHLKCESEVNSKHKLKIVYTPMHGVGHPYALKAFATFGYQHKEEEE
jgi:phosphomannomutase